MTERDKEGFAYCNLHGEPIQEETYEWKGCWGCLHSEKGKRFPYVSVSQASKELGVSESTIRRWIKKGTLEGYLYEQGRHTGSLPSPKTYHIVEKSVKELKKKMHVRV